MKTINFPYIAAGLGLMLMLVVMRGQVLGADGETVMPLLTLLVVSEFCFFVNAIAVYIGFKQIKAIGFQALYTITTLLCALLAVRFLFIGIALWPL
ncbi:hypothetical protein A9Q79_03705 [Methylophaga sp. 42_25_T18]|nr:hypothetical protein A9Q79_03705 [Methylophaga sp. 42_25_T18]